MDDGKFEKEIFEIARRNRVILQGHIKINGDTHCVLFGHFCKSTLFYKDFFNVTKATLAVNKLANRNLKQIKKLAQSRGFTKIQTKGVFSVYGDLRPLAVKAGFGEWGENGLVVNEKYGSNFLISAVFFR